ncbi:MAG: serine hydrolase domain-containing protein [Myxococcota bacterium]|nr:serine hydrolase domain-containing protein [Myxococcota bacterium]
MRAARRRSGGALALALLAASGSGSLAACRSGSLEAALPPADPAIEEPDGLGALSGWAIEALLGTSTWLGLDAGYVAIFARDGHVVYATVAGHADIERGRPMQLDTRFRMASMTKPVTATAALILVEDGRLGLDDPVSRYIPAAGALRVATGTSAGSDGRVPTRRPSRPLTVRHLLTFRAGIGDEEDPSDLGLLWAEKYIYDGGGSLADRVDRLLDAPLYEDPGESWRYGWSADVLARVVEVAAGEPFDRFLERRLFAPLGMTRSSFLPPVPERDALATVYTLDAAEGLVPVAVPRSDAPDWTPGGSGLVATAGDYLRFALMLWNRGSYDGVRILSPETVELMTQPLVTSGVLEDRGIEGLGWGFGLAVVRDPEATLQVDLEGDFWWSGLYGTTFFVSPESGLAGVVLTQHQPFDADDVPYVPHIAQSLALLGR